MNNSGVSPRGRAVMVKPFEEKKPDSLIVMPDTVQENMSLLENRAIVVEIGPACWPDEAPRAAIGDKVYVTRYAGFIVKGKDGDLYRLVNDNDIFAVILEG